MVKRLTQLQKLALRFGADEEGVMPEGVMPEGVPPPVALPDVQVGVNPNCNTSIPDINKHVGSLGHDEETKRLLGGGLNRYHEIPYDKLLQIATQYMTQLLGCAPPSDLFKTLADPLKEVLEMLCYYNSTSGIFGDPRSSKNKNDQHVMHNTEWDQLRTGDIANRFKNYITTENDRLRDLGGGLLQKYNNSVKLLETPYCLDSDECFKLANPAAPLPTEPVQEPVPEPFQEPVPEPVQEPIPEPIPESVQVPVAPEGQNLQAQVETLQASLVQANADNAAQVDRLNQAAASLEENIRQLQQEKTQLQEQLDAAGAEDPQAGPLQQRIVEAEAATVAAQQQLTEVRAQYDTQRQESLQQFETAQTAVTDFITRSRENLTSALARIESMNQLLAGGAAQNAFGFVLAYGKRQSSVPNRNLYYGRQYATIPNMFGKDILDGSEYSTDESDESDESD